MTFFHWLALPILGKEGHTLRFLGELCALPASEVSSSTNPMARDPLKGNAAPPLSQAQMSGGVVLPVTTTSRILAAEAEDGVL